MTSAFRQSIIPDFKTERTEYISLPIRPRANVPGPFTSDAAKGHCALPSRTYTTEIKLISGCIGLVVCKAHRPPHAVQPYVGIPIPERLGLARLPQTRVNAGLRFVREL